MTSRCLWSVITWTVDTAAQIVQKKRSDDIVSRLPGFSPAKVSINISPSSTKNFWLPVPQFRFFSSLRVLQPYPSMSAAPPLQSPYSSSNLPSADNNLLSPPLSSRNHAWGYRDIYSPPFWNLPAITHRSLHFKYQHLKEKGKKWSGFHDSNARLSIFSHFFLYTSLNRFCLQKSSARLKPHIFTVINNIMRLCSEMSFGHFQSSNSNPEIFILFHLFLCKG